MTIASHPLAGSILALAGEIPHLGALPQVVILPPEQAFDDPIEWPSSSLLSIANADHTTTALLPPGSDSSTVISWTILLPPNLVLFSSTTHQLHLSLFTS